MKPLKTPVYDDGRTKQSFRDETDINKILSRAQKTGTISHLAKHEARYGDFADFDFFDAQLKLTRGREIFDDLPSEVRNEFGQSQAAFFQYVNDPKNIERLGQLLPALAAPGKQNIDVSGKTPVDDPAPASAPQADAPPATPPATGEKPVDDPSGGPKNPPNVKKDQSSAPT